MHGNNSRLNFPLSPEDFAQWLIENPPHLRQVPVSNRGAAARVNAAAAAVRSPSGLPVSAPTTTALPPASASAAATLEARPRSPAVPAIAQPLAFGLPMFLAGVNGFPQNGFPPNGFPPNGFPPNGFPLNGVNGASLQVPGLGPNQGFRFGQLVRIPDDAQATQAAVRNDEPLDFRTSPFASLFLRR